MAAGRTTTVDVAGSGTLLAEALRSDPVENQAAGLVRCDLVEVEQRHAAVITLDRPGRHNALDLQAWREIERNLAELAEDRSVRAVVVRGAGGRAFSAGADIAEFPAHRIGADVAAGYNETVSAALASVEAMPFPVIAMVQGLAIGGGCELAAACDVRLAGAGARFGIPAAKLGVTLGLTETRAVSRAIGAANLKYLLLSGEVISAEQALGWGLVQKVLPEGELAAAVAELVRTICLAPEVTVRAAKQVTDLADSDPFATDSHALLRQLHAQAYDGEDLREGVAAFLERRSPQFQARRR
ncbi:enoyl-CoA hydratase/isomerase family protein [Kineosporia babensis]|uniref:Enoyl-CoA hydratase/isomerase family protein n=1 Tax=Kineosporia babensis TaxID=499548 RepID=A0A9X1SSZ9_9ACTN|nr:enoyl-CoA hydratase/isomerase family protein [Kineosporia babensis]MCD5311214.1 enoyl-CoA hydratase/isomerase family protein [Kineosporia babensis]